MKVWKFVLEVTDEQTVEMPRGAELLHVALQHGILSLWARVKPERELVGRTILIRGTGHEVRGDPYVGTVVMVGGLLVWHVFDGGE